MRKKIIIYLLAIILLITGCGKASEKEETKKVDNTEDALKFKEEYEALNGQENNGKTIRTVSISKDNPFVYKEAGDIVDMMKKKETFIVYFGFSKCPWCRSMIETLVKVSKDYQIDTIYYVDVLEIRDILKLDENNEIVTDREGTKDYLALIKLLDNVLSDYNLKDEDGNEIATGEKRIYAPNVVSVVKGKPTKLETGISDQQESAYQELTDEMLEEEYDALSNIMEEVSEKSVCDSNSKC